MEDWLLIIIIVISSLIFISLVVVVVWLIIKRIKANGNIREKFQVKSVYSSRDLNRVTQLEEYQPVIMENVNTQIDSQNKSTIKRDGFSDGELVRVDLKTKKIWKDNGNFADNETLGKKSSITEFKNDLYVERLNMADKEKGVENFTDGEVADNQNN